MLRLKRYQQLLAYNLVGNSFCKFLVVKQKEAFVLFAISLYFFE
jgi:hypothetical protein